MYSRDDIKNAIINGKLKIHPFNEKSLTGIGYNISTTHFALSIKSGVLLNVSKKTEAEGITYYVNIPANDTVLFFSREYIETDKYLFIIKYELEEINHSRRIGWQDWVIEERKYISYRSVLSKYLTGRRVKKYIIVSIITAITMWACIYIVLKICGTTEIKLIKILQDNISALTILIVSLIFNGIVEIVRRIVRRFFS